ncbi:phosphotransferase enzyme family-domain-containing protein [Aspergillus varians]
MPEQGVSGYGLRWADVDGSGELNPSWTATPDILTIQTLAAAQLSLDPSDVRIEFFAEGAFNKLYSISSPKLEPQNYLMRVVLPVDPFFKTESEVATMGFVRKHSSLPVPRVVAYSSSASNPLRFEWMLLEYVEGLPLSETWDEMSFDAKADLSMEIRKYLGQLQDFDFSWIGNLYFSKVREQVNGQPAEWLRHSTGDPENDPEFVVGRLVSPWFFRDKCLFLNADRGPFQSSCDLMLAKTDMQIERIKHLSPDPTDYYYCELDEELAKDQLDEHRVLHHDDLSVSNIILDPASFEISGIIDWESVGIYPTWQASTVPYFLRGIEVAEPPPAGTPGVNEDSLVEIRKDWERVRLRRIYGDPVQQAYGCEPSVRQHEFAQNLEEIELRWTAATYWLREISNNSA